MHFVTDVDQLTSKFVMHVDRKVRNDATCTLASRTFEVPQHLRRTTIRLHYAVLRPHLEPLRPEDVGGYLRHRMKVAGSAQEVFSEDAVLAIREASGGIPRKVDLLAQQCLELAARGKGALVDGSVVLEAVRQCAEALR